VKNCLRPCGPIHRGMVHTYTFEARVPHAHSLLPPSWSPAHPDSRSQAREEATVPRNCVELNTTVLIELRNRKSGVDIVSYMTHDSCLQHPMGALRKLRNLINNVGIKGLKNIYRISSSCSYHSPRTTPNQHGVHATQHHSFPPSIRPCP